MTAEAGAHFYRIKLPLEELAARGHEVTLISAGDGPGSTPVTLSAMSGHDIVVGQRFNHHRGLQVWRRARTPHSRLCYEIDDDVFDVTAENFQAYHLYGRPEIRDAVTHAAEVADLVTVSTEPLAQVMRERTGNRNVVVLPNHIPSWLPGTERVRRARPAIGWQGGASHGLDVGIIADPVRRFCRRFPGWDLRLAGTDYRPTFRVPQDQAVFSKWVPVWDDAPGYYRTIDFDIGLAPLAGTVFDRSKSFIKVLEYAALGIPSVACDCEAYRGFVRHGENGFLVKRDHEWLKYLSELASDDALRRKTGEAAREDARRWTIDRGYRLWEDAYAGLLRR